jgi:AcrR family transcriptional regulator
VNASLIIHYFGSKQRLFISVLEFPMDPRIALPSVLDGDPKAVGEGGARLIVALIENPDARRSLVGLIRASASEPEAAQVLKQALEQRIISPIAELVHVNRPELRASMMASQLVGLVMAQYVVGIEPLASCDSPELAAMLAPVLSITSPDPTADHPRTPPVLRTGVPRQCRSVSPLLLHRTTLNGAKSRPPK